MLKANGGQCCSGKAVGLCR